MLLRNTGELLPLQRILNIIPFRICKKNSISFKRLFNNRNDVDIANYRDYRSQGFPFDDQASKPGRIKNNEGILYG